MKSLPATFLLLFALVAEAAPGRKALAQAGIPAGCTVDPKRTKRIPDGDGDKRRDWLVVCTTPNKADDAVGTPYEKQPCVRVTIVYSRGKGIPIARYCPGGHGSRGAGEDWIKIRSNPLAQTRTGGSAWQWTETCRQSLVPPAVRAYLTTGWWNVAEHNRCLT
jgi:hypothetical protein